MVIDPRIDQVKKIVEALVTSTLYPTTNVFLDGEAPGKMYAVVDNTLLYEIPLKDIAENLPNAGFNYMEVKDLSLESILPNYPAVGGSVNIMAVDMQSKIALYPMIAEYGDLRSNEEFEKLLNLKAEDGMKFFKILANDGNNYMIPVFSGFPNLNKQDNVSVKLYDTNDDKHLIVLMEIQKKKINRTVKMYYKILKLQ